MNEAPRAIVRPLYQMEKYVALQLAPMSCDATPHSPITSSSCTPTKCAAGSPANAGRKRPADPNPTSFSNALSKPCPNLPRTRRTRAAWGTGRGARRDSAAPRRPGWGTRNCAPHPRRARTRGRPCPRGHAPCELSAERTGGACRPGTAGARARVVRRRQLALNGCAGELLGGAAGSRWGSRWLDLLLGMGCAYAVEQHGP